MTGAGEGIRRLGAPATDCLDDDALAEAYAAPQAPWLRVNFVASLDGAATVDGRSGGLGDAADRRVFEVLRRLCDVVLVGAGTVRAEGYGGMTVGAESARWRAAHGLDEQPRLAIVTNRLALPPDAPALTEAARRPLLLTSRAARDERGAAFESVADVVACGDRAVVPRLLVGALQVCELSRIGCEGGPALFASLAAADLVDEVCLTLSPRLAGGDGYRITRGAPPLEGALRLAHVLSAADTLLLRYTR